MIRLPNSYRHFLVTTAAFLAASTPLLATIATWNGQWPPVAGSYNAAVDGNVPISAVVQGTPARITLTLHRPGGYQLYRKAPDATSWGNPIATLPAGSTSYIDNNVSVGVPYEYRAMMTGTTVAARVPNGYIMAGIQVDRTEPRGRVVLVVSDTIATRLPAELDAYKRDLGAEGWTVHTLSVAAVANYSGTGNFHQPVRAQIQALNAQHPGEIKNVILLGKVPMARTGLSDGIRPDGHDNSYAEASDAYFAEMDGNWTDTGSNGQSGDVGNVPGDGKFDQFNVSLASGGLGTGQRVEFGYGRIDTSFYQASEVETTRMYLNKLARYRRAADDFRPGRRAVLRKGFDNVDETGWANMPSLVGIPKIINVTSTNDLPTDPEGRFDPDGLYTRDSQKGPFLFYFKGTGYLDRRDDDSRAVFLTGMQSHWGWWAEGTGGGQMAARIGTDNFTLNITWSIYGLRFLYHRLGLGGDMGDVIRTTINNDSMTGFYAYAGSPGIGNKNNRLWINQMGDPTIRLFPVRPPRNLTATQGGSAVSLSWSNSDDTNLVGTHIYRAPSPTGPWTRLTAAGSPTSATTFTDTPPSAGEWTYSVRAVKLETTGGGTYLNPSLGATVTVNTGTAASPLAIVTTSLPRMYWQTSGTHSLTATGGNLPYTWSLVSGSLPEGVALSADGTIHGTPVKGGGIFLPTFEVKDSAGATAQATLELGVANYRILRVAASADSMVKTSASYRGYNYGMNSGIGVVKANGVAPLYTDSIGYLRFILPSLASGERLQAARLHLTFGGDSASTSNTTLTTSLLDDSGDNWIEGNLVSGTTATSLNYNNRPTTLNATVPPRTLLANFEPNGSLDLNLYEECVVTLQSDPNRIVGLTLSSNTVSSLNFCSRENPPSARPYLELEITKAPQIEVSRPAYAVANIPSGQGLVLHTTVTADPGTTLQWTKVSGPGQVTFGNPATSSTEATFSLPGYYVLALGANDGELITRQFFPIHVLSPGKSTRDNLVLHYRMEETTGASVFDSAPDGAAHTGTINNVAGTTWQTTSRRFAGVLNVASAARYIATPDQASLDNTTSLSVAVWVNPTATSLDANRRGLISKRTNDNNQEAYTMYVQGGRVYVRFSGDNFTISTTNPVLTAGNWTHLAAVYDGALAGTAACVKIYVNGAAVATAGGIETDSSIPDSSAPLWVGHMGGNTSSYTFLGSLDEVRIYRGRALSVEDIANLLLPEGTQDAPRITINAPATPQTSGMPFALSSNVQDDGLPGSNPISLQWSALAGPTVTFNTPALSSTVATASGIGEARLRLTADDGAVATFAQAVVQVNASSRSYASWHEGIEWPPGADTTPSGDPDSDGLGNQMEYSAGSDPLAHDSATHRPTISLEDRRLVFTFTRNPDAPDLIYRIEACSDLTSGNWTTIAQSTNGDTTEDIGGGTLSIEEDALGEVLRVTVKDAESIDDHSRRFLRLSVKTE